MSKSKTMTATIEDADWSFYEDDDAVWACRSAAYKAAQSFEHVEQHDAMQDALLWLAVRPELYAKHREAGDYAQLSQDIYTNALRKPAVRESDRLSMTSSLDLDEDDE